MVKSSEEINNKYGTPAINQILIDKRVQHEEEKRKQRH